MEAKDCNIAQFKTLSPQELQAFRKAKDAIVSLPLPSCGLASSTPPFLGFIP